MPTPKQISFARTLLANTGNAGQKEAIVSGFTAGRTTSISAMQPAEFSALVRHLQGLQPGHADAEKMRRKIISMAHEMGWNAKDASGRLLLKNGRPVADMPRIDEWCKNKGYLKKTLNAYTYKELPKLLYQFEQLLAWYHNKRF